MLLTAAVVLVAVYALTLGGFGDDAAGLLLGLEPSALAMIAVAGLSIAVLLGVLILARRRGRAKRPVVASEAPDPFGAIQGRAQFMATLARLLDGHAAAGRQLALHIVDVDRFGDVNAVLGEGEGDAFLRAIAERLLVLVEHPERLGRIGDDEFAVVQPETGGARHAEIYAKRIHDALKDACAQVPRHARPAASIGVAVAPEHGDTAARLLHNASLALRSAKSGGGEAFRVFTRDMDMRLEARLQMEKAIGDGLHHGWFELRYQPQYDLRSRRLSGFEALVRLNHPDRGELLPAEFLPAAEESGLIQPLGDWIIREAIANAAEWPAHLTLSVNVSAAQFRHGDLAGAVFAAMSQANFDGPRLRIEIPEAVLAANSEGTDAQLRRLKGRGVTVVVDDFGVGGSNLAALSRAASDAVKLDLSLVRRIGEDVEVENLVRSLIGTARSFGLSVLAEGVERVEQAHFLVANNCYDVQGFLFGRPAPATETAAIVAKDLRNTLAGEQTEPAAVSTAA